ncbi:MAG: phosphate ABC transporter permease PstA [Mesorhizobium sp.]|uniref:phosphate ABC transporter permease PstA n=1 Tax=Mesorhizobium sp. TaxID=1871066 RepID=UPI000FE66053|nr:phosphate ABC transporter permease PstA [Mesorhizobium sp.]RWM22546.1 MAG: phosphate ABC transporter permease PstA [Mesorhizobium sp.]TIP75401.1 MAG: phosphate ABC transporter permease PstA [Mesorhizobium sp.]TIQ14074.1 MAG: phosphate ABC transporter permease PstA [Mesorhizobium sp.]TIR52997.1 MAG: phosphate ABC transporter permease PstA [Mesorhizobium sp.]TJV98656.1 MAG: phosphate ABC transporter permease PstA [Mesorhizobium sp.]
MTDAISSFGAVGRPVSIHTDDAAKARLKGRYRTETWFKWLGAGAVALAGLFLVLLLSTIVTQAIPALRQNYLTLPIDLSAAKVDPAKLDAVNYDAIAQEALTARFPDITSRQDKRLLRGLISTGTGVFLRKDIAADPGMLGGTVDYAVPLDDFADLYLKGLLADVGSDEAISTSVTPSKTSGDIDLTFGDDAMLALARGHGATEGENGMLTLTSGASSLLVVFNGGTVKLTALSPGPNGTAVAKGTVIEALDSTAPAASDQAFLRVIDTPEASRKISDKEIVWLDTLKSAGQIESRFNSIFFFTGASREPELAGVWGAVVGSFLTMIVTLAIAFPIGVSAAIYLEEFAPKNRLTTIIEVNINNLAAVPSIVFGLLGLAVFLNFFGMPRSAPVVGGMVLALMTLPIIIIASRASLRAVPPSIREAALGIGASKVQTVFHHVLPLAMPGIMTGTILGMAHALGETAPLLMIGMVAFIVDIPAGFTDPATILPVQIFMWADFPEAGFQQKTSAAILILLVFLVIMNAIAVILRRRFERRW